MIPASIRRSLVTLSLALAVMPCASSALLLAQNIDVTFRYVERLDDDFVRVFNPGEFNNWGNNSSGVIAPTDGSIMTYDATLDQHLYTVSLQSGRDYAYKVHFHFNDAGTNWLWISDPYNDRLDGSQFDNSLMTVGAPMVLQLARREVSGGSVGNVSAGIFSDTTITEVTFEINGVSMSGMPFVNFFCKSDPGMICSDPALADSSRGVLTYDLPSPVPSGSQFKVSVVDADGGAASDEVGLIPPQVVDEPVPEGIRDGVNLLADPTQVTFSLFAPAKHYVYLIGDFNNWEIRPEFLMKRDSLSADSIRWWITLTGLTPSQEYGFQYLVDGQIRVADPFAHKLLDRFHDVELQSVYPDLKPYPAASTSQMVGVFRTGEPVFDWTPFARPDQKDLVIYEMLIRDFVEAHDYATLIDTLDYLDRLGVNAIELMPVAEFDGNSSWGYNPAFHLAPDKYYGPAKDLKRFVDECHKRGIAVILDVVYNHATGQSPLVRLYNDSATGDPSALPRNDNIYVNRTARHPFNVFNDVNHESTATRHWLDRANEYWLTEFNMDGFRFDLSKGFTQKFSTDDGVFRLYDPGRISALKRMADRIWDVDSTAYIILEHFAEDREERELAAHGTADGRPGMMLWNNKNFNYNEATMGYHDSGKSNFASVYYGPGGRGWTLPNVVSYMESHDEQWLMFKNLAFGACTRSTADHTVCDPADPANFGTYNVRQLGTALDRMKMAGAFFFTLPGPKMMWQFGELGYGYGDNGEQCLRGDDCPPFAPARTGRKPIRWDYRNDPLRERLYKAWSAIINLRNDYEVFTSTETDVAMSVSGAVKRIVLTHPSMNVTVVGNFDVMDRSAAPAYQHTGTWYDFFSGSSFEVTNVAEALTLEPGEFHIFTDVQVPSPEPGLITVGTQPASGPDPLPAEIRLEPVYPNPFRDRAVIRFQVPHATSVRLEVYDVLGRRVSTLVRDMVSAGEHEFEWDTTGLPSGVYVARLAGAGSTRMTTMTRVR